MKTKLRRLEEENNRKDKQIEQLLDPSRVTVYWGDKSGAKECWAVWSSFPCLSRFQESVVRWLLGMMSGEYERWLVGVKVFCFVYLSSPVQLRSKEGHATLCR